MTTIVIYREDSGRAPFLDWFDRLPEKAKVQCRARLELAGQVQYRMLYFFHGQAVVVISHGITKKDAAVPPIEIERARRREHAFEADPPRHTYKETL